MPEEPDTPIEPIIEKAKEIAKENGAIGEMQVKEEPIGFGLKAIMLLAMYEVEGNDFEAIAAKIAEIDSVQTAEVAKMDLPLG